MATETEQPEDPNCRVKVLLLWHMHQPCYIIPGQPRALLPWTRLHALKDYVDMPALLEEFPGLRVTFNLVPSLLRQLVDYAAGRLTDPFQELSEKPAADLTKEDQIYLLKNFFSLDWGAILTGYPRLAQLLRKRGRTLYVDKLPVLAEKFSSQDFLDLQLLFNLAWSGNLLLQNPIVRALVRKERGYSEKDKETLLAIHNDFLGQVLPAYQRVLNSGQAEISASPMYHPILPLLMSTDLGKESDSRTPLPSLRFSSKEDAEYHIAEAVRVMADDFGFRFSGMWPSEGSVAQELVPLWGRSGIRWVASDEEILWNSLRRSGIQQPDRNQLYTPYRLSREGESVAIFFRDHELSDLLGFSYSRWNPEKAAQDFMERLARIGDRWRGLGPAAVSVILDGENAWEHYPENGRPFLREFYEKLCGTPGVRTCTFGQWLEASTPMPELPLLHPGSWIFGNFSTWMGHPEKNRGWEELARTRQVLADAQKIIVATGADVPAALEAMYRAEGSDWFWWYGDDHASDHKEEFDQLFRANLQEVYRALGKPIPNALKKPLRLVAPVRPHSLPSCLIRPQIDGQVSHFFEWRGAGAFQVRGGGAMQQTDSVLDTVYFGYDLDHLYFRVDFRRPMNHQSQPVHLALWMENRENFCLRLAWNPAAGEFETVDHAPPHELATTFYGSQVKLAFERVLEVGFPAAVVQLKESDRLLLHVELVLGDRVLERWPQSGSWEFSFAPIELDQNTWYI